MASIIDVFGRLLLEDGGKQFIADAAKAGDAAGGAASQTMGKRVSTGLKTAMGLGTKALAAGAATAFGIATKGALEMENATARYRAETGATAEEAKAALGAVNQIAGRQRMSLEGVTDIAIKVRRDLGLVGDEADKMTERFALFARVTRQDAAGAVAAFDDIIDAWGISASDAAGIMDQLVVSGQKYGGTIEEDQAALAKLAPALRAANLGVDDAISLLDIFKASGVDSAAAVTGMNKALGKVKSPAELQALIADISNTADPFERAQKAIDLFGSKAGPKLANALAGKSLEDFAIGMDEAAGATERAGEAIDSTFSARVQRALSEAGAALRGFGAELGPAITGAASLASLGGSLGLDKLLSKGFGKLAGSALVKGAAGKAGASIGLVFTTAMFASDTIGSALSGAFNRLPGSGAIKGAGSKLGNVLGTSLGKAASLAFAGIMVVEVFETYNRVKGELQAQNTQISSDLANVINKGTRADLEQAKNGIEQGLRDINGVWDAGIFTTDTRKQLEANLAAVTGELERRAGGMGPAVADGIESGKGAVSDAAGELGDAAVDGLDDAPPEAKKTGIEVSTEFAQGILTKQDEVATALGVLRNQVKSELTPAGEIARAIGILTSKELAKALRDNRPGVRAAAQALRDTAEQRLAELIAGGGRAGKKASAELAKGLRSKDADVRAAAQRVKAIVDGKLQAAANNAGTQGTRAGNNFANNLRNAIQAAMNLAIQIRTAAANPRHGKARGGAVHAGTPYLVNEETPRSEVFVPSTPGYVLTRRQAQDAMRERISQPIAVQGGDTHYTFPVQVTGLLAARKPEDLARPLRQLAATGLITTPADRRRMAVPKAVPSRA